MYRHPRAAAQAVGGLPGPCPTCHKPLTAEAVCWACCDRLCRSCEQPTGSAFIDICWPCWFRAGCQHEADEHAAAPAAVG
jgi:hypothetical protein